MLAFDYTHDRVHRREHFSGRVDGEGCSDTSESRAVMWCCEQGCDALTKTEGVLHEEELRAARIRFDRKGHKLTIEHGPRRL
jgi:hypothetical protein